MGKIKFITVCHNLHNYGGHEYMYTQGICDSMPPKFSHDVWGRKDVIADIQAKLRVKPVFSRVEYNQEMNIFLKACKLVEREFRWFIEFKHLLKTQLLNIKREESIVFFVHTFSIYNVWSWLYLKKYFQRDNVQVILFFRYSSLLLPKFLKPFFYWLCSRFPKDSRNFLYLTDTEQLKIEYAKNCGLNLFVVPVVAKTNYQHSLKGRNGIDKTIHLSYLGSARVDKGFQHLPSIIEKVYSMNLGDNIKFTIQASIPGVDYLESPCEIALQRLKVLSEVKGYNIQLILEHLSEDAYDDLLAETNLVLLPYTGISYKAHSSGILVEAMSYGLPCIVPQNTWMESELNRTGGGVAFDPRDPEDLAKSVCRLLEDFSSHDALAKKGAKEMKYRHGAQAQAAEIVKLIAKYTKKTVQ